MTAAHWCGMAGRRRNGVFWAAAAVVWTLLVPVVGNAQPGNRLHEDAVCGFRVSYPAGWEESWETPEGQKEARFYLRSPKKFDSYVVINGIWDTSAIGKYPSGGSGDRTRGEEARAVGTLAEVLMGDQKLPGELVWTDQLRSGPIAISYLMQLQENGTMYHYSMLLVSRGPARGLQVDGWSYSVIGAWVPRPLFREVAPVVMGIVKSIEFIKAGKACWTT